MLQPPNDTLSYGLANLVDCQGLEGSPSPGLSLSDCEHACELGRAWTRAVREPPIANHLLLEFVHLLLTLTQDHAIFLECRLQCTSKAC
jgi:hypothetical protein